MDVKKIIEGITHEGCKELCEWLEQAPSWGFRMMQAEALPKKERYLIFNKYAANGRLLPLEVCVKIDSGMVSISGPRETGIQVSFSKALASHPKVVKVMLREFADLLPKGQPLVVNK